MERWIRFSGIAGLVVFLFGILGVLVTNSFAIPLVFMHLLLGLLLMIVWFFAVGVSNVGRAGEVIAGRNARFGANVAAYTAVFVGLLIVVNYFAGVFNKKWDTTAEGVYSLASQSREIVKNLKKPLKMVVFANADAPDKRGVKDQLDQYVDANAAKVSYEIIDPRAKPHLVEKYDMKQGNLLYLQYGEETSGAVGRVNEFTEQAITNAILKLTMGSAKKVYFVQGHGEPDIENGTDPTALKKFSAGLSDEHLTPASVFLAETGKVPEDAAVVVLVSPKKPLRPEERELLLKYARSGGRLVMFTDPRTTDDVKELAANFGITINNDIVIDQVQRLFAAPSLGAQPIVRDYGPHPITAGLTRQTVTIFNLASTISLSRAPVAGETLIELIKTGPNSWAEANVAGVLDNADPTAEKDDADRAGPVALGAVHERKILDPKDTKPDPASGEVKDSKVIRVVVFSDSDWIQNYMFDESQNRDLALNSINWAVGEEAEVKIGQRSMKKSTAAIPLQTFIQLMAMSFVLPEMILIFGLFVWWRRRAVSV